MLMGIMWLSVVTAMAVEPQIGKICPANTWNASNADLNDGLREVETKDYKVGWVDKDWRLVILPVYDYTFNFNAGQAMVKKDGKWGFINKKGVWISSFNHGEVLDCKYDYSKIIVREAGKTKVLNRQGRLIQTLPYDFLSKDYMAIPDGKWLIPVKKDGKWGFMDQNYQPVGAPQYDGYSGCFSDGLLGVKKDGKWGYIDTTGRLVIPIMYDKAGQFTDHHDATVTLNGQRIDIDKNGRVLRRYDSSGQRIRSGGRTRETATDEEFDAYMEELAGPNALREGRIYPANHWTSKESYSDGLAAVSYRGSWGYIDKDGRLVIMCQFDKVFPFYEGRAFARQNGRWNVIDKSGTFLKSFPKGCYIKRVFNNVAVAWNGNDYHQTGLVNDHGNTLIPPHYDTVKEQGMRYSESNLIGVEKDGKYGFYNIKLKKLTIPLIYDDCNYFFEGLAAVKKNGKWGVINTSGQVVVPLLYEKANFVEPGGKKIQVKKNGKWILINI